MTMMAQVLTVHKEVKEVGGTIVVIEVISLAPTLVKYGNVSYGTMVLFQ